MKSWLPGGGVVIFNNVRLNALKGRTHRIDFTRLCTGAPGLYLTGFGEKRLGGSVSDSERRGPVALF